MAQSKSLVVPLKVVIFHSYVNVYQRVNLHLPMFSYVFPRCRAATFAGAGACGAASVGHHRRGRGSKVGGAGRGDVGWLMVTQRLTISLGKL